MSDVTIFGVFYATAAVVVAGALVAVFDPSRRISGGMVLALCALFYLWTSGSGGGGNMEGALFVLLAVVPAFFVILLICFGWIAYSRMKRTRYTGLFVLAWLVIAAVVALSAFP